MTTAELDGAGWIDVTVPIHDGMVHWPGDAGVRVVREKDLARGDTVTVSRLELGAHTGTHVDAPMHFLPGGGGVDELDLAGLLGPARVVELPGVPVITAKVVEGIAPRAGERILFHTDNSARCWGTSDFVTDY